MNSNRSKRGLTLVEVIIAGGILAFTLCAFLSTFVMAQRAAVMADDYMQKMHDTRQIMEELISYNFDDTRLSSGTHTISVGKTYVVTDNPSYQDTKDIILTVSWTEPAGSKTWSLSIAGSMTKGLHQ